MKVTVAGTEDDCAEVRELIYEKDNKFKKDRLDLSDNETVSLVEFACKVSKFTDGAFDITVSPLCDIWGFWNHEFRVPAETEISETLKYTGYENIQINQSEIILPEGFAIDFGGIAKGYTGDCISHALKEKNISSAVIALGGNIHTIGRKTNGNLWKIGIKDPFGEKDYYGTVSVEDCAVVTSGGYERYFEENGKTYQHIINPLTGYTAESDVKSVTVISENGALADALSTAFYVMGSDKTAELCENSGCSFEGKSFSVILILNDGSHREYGETGLDG